MRKICRFLSLLLALIMVVTLFAGCSRKEGHESSDGTKPEQEESTKEKSEQVSEDKTAKGGPLDKYDETVTVTIASEYVDIMGYAEGEDENDNLHTRLHKEWLNIDYKNYWYVDASKGAEKVNLAIASNDLPDVMRVNISQLQSVIKNDQVEDLTDVYENFISDRSRELLEFQNKVAFIPAISKDRLYGIPLPSQGGYGERVPVMFIHKGWLDNVGMKVPTNLDELMEVSKAFVENDPDKDGKKDTYAITLDKNLGQMTFNAIANAHKAYPSLWIKDDSGKIVYGSVQPEMKEALRYMQDLFKIGAFDPEFAVKDLSKVYEMVAAEEIGIHFGIQSGAIDPFMRVKQANENFDLCVAPIPAGKDGTVIPGTTPFTEQWLVVKKGFKYPEAPIKSMNLTAEMLYNEEHELWEWWTNTNDDPKYKGLWVNMYIKPYPWENPMGWLNASRQIREWRATGDKSKLTVGAKKIVEQMIEPGGPLGWAMSKTFEESWKVIDDYGDKLKYPDYFSGPTPTMISRKASLDKMELETFINIIMGESLDKFDEFVNDWYRLGGNEIIKEVNEAAKEMEKR